MPLRRSLSVVFLALLLIAAGCSSSDDATVDGATAADAAAGDASADAGEPSDTVAGEDESDPAVAGDETESGNTTGSSDDGDESTAAAASRAPAVLPQPSNCGSTTAGATTIETDAGGPTIRARIAVPSGFEGEPLPAIFDFHGLGSDGTQQALLSDYESLGEREGLVVIHPTGVPALPGGPNSWELAQFDAPGRDDIAAIDDLIDRVVTEHCVDPTRIYATGMSNGGFFTSLLVCERADRIAAAISVAGVSHPPGCEPSRPVPFIAFHGTEDEVVPFAGGDSSLQSGPADAVTEAFFAQSMPDEFGEFAIDFGCDPEPTVEEVGDEVVRYDYTGCEDGVPLTFYEIVGGGHTWPGSPLGPVLTGALGYTTTDVAATADGWAFASAFSLPTG